MIEQPSQGPPGSKDRLPRPSDIYFNPVAVERVARARCWTQTGHKGRKAIRKWAKKDGAITAEGPAGSGGASGQTEAFLSLGPHVFLLSRNTVEVATGAKPWVATDCLTDPTYVPKPVVDTRPNEEAPRPASASEVVRGLVLTTHCISRFRDRVEPELSVEAAEQKLRESLGAESVLSLDAPSWLLSTGEPAGFLIAGQGRVAELCIPFVWDPIWKRRPWVGVTCVGKDWAESERHLGRRSGTLPERPS